MADEREGYGPIGGGSEETSRSGFGSRDAGTARSTFGSGIDESGFEGSEDARRAYNSDDAGTRAGSYDRKFTGEDDGKSTSSGRDRVADQLQRVGSRIEERARHLEESGGVQRRAGRVVMRAGEALDSSADYIRNHEVNEMRDDLESAIRERPLLSVGIAVGAGFLLARLMRD